MTSHGASDDVNMQDSSSSFESIGARFSPVGFGIVTPGNDSRAIVLSSSPQQSVSSLRANFSPSRKRSGTPIGHARFSVPYVTRGDNAREDSPPSGQDGSIEARRMDPSYYMAGPDADGTFHQAINASASDAPLLGLPGPDASQLAQRMIAVSSSDLSQTVSSYEVVVPGDGSSRGAITTPASPQLWYNEAS